MLLTATTYFAADQNGLDPNWVLLITGVFASIGPILLGIAAIIRARRNGKDTE